MVMMEAYFWKYFINPARLIDHFIFVSNFSKGKHLEFYNIYQGRYTQIYNFTHFTDHNPQIIRGHYFLYFGRLSIEKGVKTLVAAFSNEKHHKLKIAGTGPLMDFVEEASKINENINYVGFKTGNELAELIRNASFIILPSECYENNPLAIVEAYSFSKPVIGAQIAGIPELINDRANGFLFRSGDRESLESAINASALITDNEYESYSKSVLYFAQLNFDIGSHYLSLMKVYNNVINQTGTK